MKPRPELPPGPYLVVGLARSGRAAALTLRARGERVIGLDSGKPADLDALLAAGVELHLGEQDGASLVERAACIVKSPGVPAAVPAVQHALAERKRVLGELELAWRLLANEFIAVTGTNGKTTTVELIGHIHGVAGVPATVAGNVGVALSGLVGRIDPAATIVCEASSFQLEDALAFSPELAVLLNLAPDHLDRHGTFEHYRQAKLRIFARQDAGDTAALPAGLELGTIPGAARRVFFGAGEVADLSLADGVLYWRGKPLVKASELRIPGRHNLQNAMAAAAACLVRGLDPRAVCEGLRSFPGVAHRLQEVTVRDGVRYVNDSKATNVASTLVALDALAGAHPGIHLILGGRGKGQDFAPLRLPVERCCRAVYLIGEDAERIATALDGATTPMSRCETIERAVERARGQARPGETVLLSPACASFDQFVDFEARGERFRELVSPS
ncbi:MAG TPA: UDP-N-acetylmuramoyl-L-alanine--D-glutamate ligase [Solirubrobacteraceae bacterium]|nr:UDP-N-acetylmuramoyl-L-alanine--D-glutamate ligase [Solirubrobacteraceae bacterium]